MHHPFHGITALVALVALLPLASARSDDGERTRPVRVAIFTDDGVSKEAPAQVTACLPESQLFEVENVTAKQIRGGALEKFDVIIHPGGSGSGQAKALGEDGREKVREFVQRGGGYVGVCAGAYLASAEYPWALKLLDATVVDGEHWARGTGEVKLQITAPGRDALSDEKTSTTVYYENGPLLGPANRSEIPDFESLATFETEIRENDAPKGVMLGTTAIARGEFGKGRVVCFSPHPEKSRGCESFLADAVQWAGDSKNDGDDRRDK